jgi:prepilin-type N-terminal cleavage/methylation domain-containing protein
MNERGVVLLEVLVAVAILSMTAVSSIGFIAASLEAQGRLDEREAELATAAEVLTIMALLSRRELDQRIGVRDVAGFAVWVDRPEPSLFRVGVAPGHQPGAEVVSTLIFRPSGAQ